MLKMFRYMKKSAGYLLLIFGLLFVQAFCDLSLPSYTSKIVDVGIQQKGVEDAVPDKIREVSMEMLLLFMTEEDQQEVLDAYEKKEGLYELKKISKDQREELNRPLAEAMMIASGIQEKNVDLSSVSREQIAQMLPQMKEKVDDMSSSIITQAAVTYVQTEYAKQGRDVN